MSWKILFIQGAGQGTHDHWDDKLEASLRRELGEDYTVRYPRMPDEGDPTFPAWNQALAAELRSLDKGVFLVGHSFGGTVAIHALAALRPLQGIGGLFLIAPPYVGKGGWPNDGMEDSGAVCARLPSDLPVFIYHGTNDRIVPAAHVDLYANALPHAAVRILDDRDHQLNNDMSDVARDIRSV